LNKIIQTQDFLFASSRNGITNLEQDNIFDHLNIPEDKSFSDLNLFSIGNQPLQFNFDVKNDFTINSFDDFQDSKKSELGFECLAKDIKKDQFEYKKDNIDEEQKYLKNNIPIPFLRQCDLIEENIGQFPITIYGDNIPNEKIILKNEVENENENELTNQNSGIFYKFHKRKINKFRKKIKFLVLTNSKKSIRESLKKKRIRKIHRIVGNKKNLEQNNKTQNILISKEISEKIINKKYKYKCEHPGCTKTFKTLKLKLNRHDLSDYDCKKDTITLLYMINKTQNIIKKFKRKNHTRINRLKKLYKKCIFNLPHRDYAINIAGNNLIN